jgi:hypothetical protein
VQFSLNSWLVAGNNAMLPQKARPFTSSHLRQATSSNSKSRRLMLR